ITDVATLIHNQARDAKLHHRPHEFGLALAPAPAQRQPQDREQLIAQRLLAFIVFRRGDCQDRRGASRADHVTNAHRLPAPRLSHNHMPGTLVPGRTQHGLKTAFKGRLDKHVLAKERMGHGAGSLRIGRMGKTRTGRSGSASGTAGGSVRPEGFVASRIANRSGSAAGCRSYRWWSHYPPSATY